MSDVQAKIIVTAEDRASQPLENVQKKVSDLDKLLERVGNSFSLTTIASTALGFSLANLGERSVNWAKNVIVESVEAADKLKILDNRAEVLFGDRFPQASRAIDEMASALNRDRSEIEGFAVEADAFAQSMGMGKEQAEQLSLGMGDLAVKIGQATGRNEEEAFGMLERGLKGMGRALVEVGIDLDANRLQEYMNAEGVKMHYEKLDDASKAIVAYNYILSQKATIDAQAAKNQDAYTEKLKQFWSAWNDLEEALGRFTVGPASALIQGLTAQVKELSSWTGIVATQFRMFGFGEFATAIEGFANLKTPEAVKSGAQTQDEFFKSTLRLTQSQIDNIHAHGMMKTSLKEMPDLTGKAAKAQEELMNRLDDLKEKYERASQTIADKMTMLDEVHKSKVQSIQDSIDNLQDSLKDLKQSYADTVDAMNKKGEDLILGQDEVIKNLEKKIKELEQKASDENRKGSVSVKTNDEMEQARKDLEQAKKDRETGVGRMGLDATDLAQIAHDERQGKFLTAVDRFNQEDARKLRDYEQKTAEISGKLAKKNDELKQENENYDSQRKLLTNTQSALDAFHDKLVFAMEHADVVTKKSVESMNKQLGNLIENLTSFQRIMANQTGTSGPGGVPGWAAGGGSTMEAPTMRGPSYDLSVPTSSLSATRLSDQLAGPGGVQYASPYATASDFSNVASRQATYGGIVINLTGDHIYNSDMDARTVARTMASEMARQVQLQALGAN